MNCKIVLEAEELPKMAFSNKINLTYKKTEYRNSRGRHLLSSGGQLSIELIAQNRGSGNLFDTAFIWAGKHFDPDAVLSYFKEQYDAFYVPATLEAGRYPVIAAPENIFSTFLQHFVGDLYIAGSSLLSGKLGEKIFHDKLTLRDDLNPASSFVNCFFDAEGCVAKDYRAVLIESGVLKGLLTTRKTAEQYGLTNLGTADAPYDGVPQIGFHSCSLEQTADTLKELVPGKAVYVIIASGGDTTPDGHFATPVQMAYLMEDGHIVGRLPEIAVSGNFFDMLGKDYLGTVHNCPFEKSELTAVMMDVKEN